MRDKSNTVGNKGILKRLDYIAFFVLLLVAATVVGLIIASKNTNTAVVPKDYSLSIIDGEQVAVADARLAVAQSAVDGNGQMTGTQCDTLGLIAKNFNREARWFSNCKFSLLGSTPDTDSESVLKLSDGDYCAKFVLDKDLTTLSAYSFIDGECGDARISIEQDS